MMEGGITPKLIMLSALCIGASWFLLMYGLHWGLFSAGFFGLGVAFLIDCIPGDGYSNFWPGRTFIITACNFGYWYLLIVYPWLTKY